MHMYTPAWPELSDSDENTVCFINIGQDNYIGARHIARSFNGETEFTSIPTMHILLFPHTACLFSDVGNSVSIKLNSLWSL